MRKARPSYVIADLVVLAEAVATWLMTDDPGSRLVAVVFALGTAYIVRQIHD